MESDPTVLGVVLPDAEFSVSLSGPTSVDICITKACNQRCVHCYNPWRMAPQIAEPEESPENVALLMSELARNGVWQATLTGGEPLMNRQLLLAIVDEAVKREISMTMNSNLGLMDDEIGCELKRRGFESSFILTSLPSVKEEACDTLTRSKGSYRRILRGMDVCRDLGLPFGVNFVISRDNVDELEHILEFVRAREITYVSITRAIPPLFDFHNDSFKLSETDVKCIAEMLVRIHSELGVEVGSVTPLPLCLLQDVERYSAIISSRCAAGLSRCSIDLSSGSVTACTHENGSYGNVYKDGLRFAWKNMQDWRRFDRLDPACRECSHLVICGGECRMLGCDGFTARYQLRPFTKALEDGETRRNASNVSPDTEYDVSSAARCREESFGGVVHVLGNESYVNTVVFAFCMFLRERRGFTVKDLFEFVEEDEYLMLTLATLERIGYLTRRKSNADSSDGRQGGERGRSRPGS